MQFEAKNVVITGGTGGIGLALARCFLTNGAEVMNMKKQRMDFVSTNELDKSIKSN